MGEWLQTRDSDYAEMQLGPIGGIEVHRRRTAWFIRAFGKQQPNLDRDSSIESAKRAAEQAARAMLTEALAELGEDTNA